MQIQKIGQMTHRGKEKRVNGKKVIDVRNIIRPNHRIHSRQ